MGSFKSVEEVKNTKNVQLSAHLFDFTVLPALTLFMPAFVWPKILVHAINVALGKIERKMLEMARFTQVREGLLSSELRRSFRIRNTVPSGPNCQK